MRPDEGQQHQEARRGDRHSASDKEGRVGTSSMACEGRMHRAQALCRFTARLFGLDTAGPLGGQTVDILLAIGQQTWHLLARQTQVREVGKRSQTQGGESR